MLSRIKKILVVVPDGTPAGRVAFDLAADLSARSDGGVDIKLVDVLECIPWYARMVLPDPDEIQSRLARERKARLSEEFAAPARGEGVGAEVEVLVGRPEDEIVREVLRHGHDLLIKAAEGPGAPSRRAIDMPLLRHCPCPVWLARPSPDGSARRVLVALDPVPEGPEAPDGDARNALNVRLLGLAAAVAEWRGAELHVVHAWDAPGEGLLMRHGSPATEVQTYIEEAREQAGRALHRLIEPHRHRIASEGVHLIRGLPSAKVPWLAAKLGVDLLVMGTHAREGVSGLLIGNTAETVLPRVGCSVLAVKPEGYVSPIAFQEAGAAAAPPDIWPVPS